MSKRSKKWKAEIVLEKPRERSRRVWLGSGWDTGPWEGEMKAGKKEEACMIMMLNNGKEEMKAMEEGPTLEKDVILVTRSTCLFSEYHPHSCR